jgi:two-component SAPR family response regulator
MGPARFLTRWAVDSRPRFKKYQMKILEKYCTTYDRAKNPINGEKKVGTIALAVRLLGETRLPGNVFP